MRSKIREEKIGENCAQAEQVGKPHLRSAFLSKLRTKSPTKLGAAVFALIVLHFVSQFVFFQGEKQTSQIDNEQSVEIKTQYEVKTPEVTKMPDAKIPLIVKPETESSAPASKTVIRKKEQPRETRAERLRRAERILTGA